MIAIGIVLAAGSSWFDRQASSASDSAFSQAASSAACMLFTLTGVFVVIGGYEFQRARVVQRLNQLEREIELLKSCDISAT